MSQPARRHSAFQDGFAALWHDPALLLAELTWRWCFGFSAWALAIISAALFLDSLKISHGDEFLLGTLQPLLISSAVRHILHGSATRFLAQQVALFLGLTLLWSLAATAGRAATLGRLVAMFSADEEPETLRWEFGPIFVLQLLRAIWSLIALTVMILLLALGTIMAADARPMRAALLLSFGVGLAWAFGAVLNWFFAVTPLFCIRTSAGAMDALAQCVNFAARQSGRLFGLGLGFGALRLVWAGTMFFVVLAPINWARHIAPGWVIVAMVLLALIYFAGADLLYLARLGAYASLAEDDSRPAEEEAVQPAVSPIPATESHEVPQIPETATG
ncbi:MAG: hypothetical protein P4M04_03495 [Acidobacteriota bacterium]|nr:hypothetical protein [Acidobacteriota bacterium]